MRILTFLHSFETGGVERTALRLVRQWRADGIDAPLWMGRETGPMRADLAGDMDYHMPRQPFFPIFWMETLWMIWKLPAAIRRIQPDMLFCAGNSYSIVTVMMKLILGRACPPVIVKVSNDLDRRDMPLPVRWLYHRWLAFQGRFFDGVVAMAPAMEAEIIAHMRVPPERVVTICDPAIPALPPLLPRARREGDTGRRFVTIGRLAPQKNHRLMLAAFAAGRAKDDRLTIIGDGPLRPALEKQARELGIADAVTWTGYLDDAGAALGDHDIFLLSSDYEGVPAVLVEALAAAMPVIATDCSAAISAMLEDGALGRIVPVGDADALAQAIRDAGTTQNAAAARAMASVFTVQDAASHYVRTARRLLQNAAKSGNGRPKGGH